MGRYGSLGLQAFNGELFVIQDEGLALVAEIVASTADSFIVNSCSVPLMRRKMGARVAIF